jgi:hypothetical protein
MSRRSSGRNPLRYDEIRGASSGAASRIQVCMSSVARRAWVKAIVRSPSPTQSRNSRAAAV